MNTVLPHQSPSQTTNLNDWQKLSSFIRTFPQFSESQLRWLLLHRKTNGLNKHVRKIGKPLYINVSGFISWIENHTEV